MGFADLMVVVVVLGLVPPGLEPDRPAPPATPRLDLGPRGPSTPSPFPLPPGERPAYLPDVLPPDLVLPPPGRATPRPVPLPPGERPTFLPDPEP